MCSSDLTDTLKFKIGPATATAWNSIASYANVTPDGLDNGLGDYIPLSSLGEPQGPAELDVDGNLLIPYDSIIFEGQTANAYETTLKVAEPTADRTVTIPNATTTLVGTDTTDTLTNKTLTNPTITGLYLGDGSVVFEGATADSYETTVTVAEPTADRTITIPNVTGTIVTTGDTGTVSNAMLAGSIPNNKLANSSVTINGYEIALGASASYGTDNISEGTTNLYFTNERAQDAVASALAAGTHTNITVSYNDNANSISLTGAETYNDEMARDAIGAALTGGTGITITPNDNADTITVAVNNTIATKTYADNAVSTGISNLIASAPSALDTLNELAAALGNDANFSTTVTNALAGKQDKITGVSDTEISYLDGVTSAIQTQIDSKAPTASPTFTGTVSGITKSMVGLANVDNTSDANKPISTATQSALDLKAPLASPTFTGTVTLPTGTVTSTMIADGTIVNADINASAAISLSKLATDPLARANHTGTQTASTISNFDTQVRTSKVTDLAAPTGSFSMNSQKITNLATPTAGTDAANKDYVDAAVQNVNIHESVVAATTANVNLNNAVDNNKTLDGVTLSTGNRILVKNQNTASQNGIYIVAANGAPTRATDYDAAGEVSAGDFIFVSGGTVNGNTGWIQTAVVTTVGTDSLSFTQFSGAGTYTASTGLSLSGTAFAIDSTVATLTGTQTLTNKTLTSPTITGTGAIAGTFTGNLTGDVTGNVSGNAGTVTNGVYTTGSYSNPSWITALGWSKVSGTPTTVSGYGITDAVATGGSYSNPSWLTSLGWSKITSTPTTLSGYGITDAQPLDADLTAIAGLAGTSGLLKKTAADTWTLDTNTYLTTSSASSTYLPLTGGTISSNLTITGNLTVNGSTTTVNSTTLAVTDKNIEIANVASPTNITADGAGITVKGTTDKTFNWVAANTAFTSSENVDIASGKTYKIAGTDVLTGSALGSGITSSSLTSVGTITSGTWNGTTIAVASGGTGATTASGARTNLGVVIGTDVQAYNATLAAVAAGTYTGSTSITTLGTITSGTWNGTAIAVANGGTGSTTASGARTNLGLAIGTDVQAYNSTLAAVAGGTYTGATSITTLGTIATGTWSATTIATTKGGTGLTSYTTGDVLYASGTNTLAKLAAGTDGYLLTMSSGVPTWAAAPVSLPSQTGYSGYYLTTNGSTASWGQLPISIPSNTTISTNTANTVDTTALSGFTSLEYMVSLKQGSKVRTSKVIVQTDGTSVDMTEFAITETGGTMTGVVVSATTVSTNAVLQVTVTDASSTNVTVKLSKITR